MLKYREAIPFMLLMLLGSTSSCFLNSSMAWLHICRLSGVSTWGTHCWAYAVARYRRATESFSSRATAFLKCSIAVSYFAALYAWTPLFNWSRALSLLHPAVKSSTSTAAATIGYRTLLFMIPLTNLNLVMQV